MNALLTFASLAVVFFLVPTAVRSDEPSPWAESDLVVVEKIAWATMGHYAGWVEDFRAAGRSPNDEDVAINLMAEEILVHLLKPLADRPNLPLLRGCLRFLGETVPECFDDYWRLVLLEMSSNIDRKVGAEIDAELEKAGRKGLRHRAMAPALRP
ncbi:MAG TPA: hypothetical protein PLA50_15050 [Bacteroidia bacterium]|nr:hypothetical protein [Bacteroidia bacterium]